MSRFALVVLIAVVLAVGVVVGVQGRAWLGDAQDRRSDAGTTGPVAQNPPSAPAAAPTVLPTRPTVAPTAVPASQDVVLEVSESDLQSQLSTMLVGHSLGPTPLGEATIQSVTVQLRDRQVKVGGDAKAGFLSAPFTAIGTVVPDAGGRVVVRITEATVGGVLLPDAAKAALADSLQTQVDGLFAQRSMKVRTIDIIDGKMRVVGSADS